MDDLILLTGPDGVGKDFFFKNRECVNDYYIFFPPCPIFNYPPCTYKRIAFADPIKLSLNPNIEDITNSGLKRDDIIKEANRLKEIFGEDIFVSIAINEIYAARLRRVVITDLRFKNEYNFIKSFFPHAKVVSIGSNLYRFPLYSWVRRNN